MNEVAEREQQQEIVYRSRFVTLAGVKDLIEREQTEREELTYEQKLALEHVTLFAKVPTDPAKELVEKLLDLGGRVTEAHAYKIADLMPTHADDVRAIFQKDRVAPEPEDIDRIIETVAGYL